MSTYLNFQFQLRILSLAGSLCIAHNYAWSSEKIPILEAADYSAWEKKIFDGDTQYSTSEMAGRTCIKAHSQKSASGLFKDVKIDLHKTPVLHWDWFIENTLGDIDETQKDGDDYAARIYVVMSGGLFFWNTRALNYVWASQKPKASVWPNAFSSNAIMFAVESGTRNNGRWVHEQRNVLDDIKEMLGTDSRYIDAVAIMTDTDNTQKQAVACYGDIYFSEQ